MQLVRVKRFQHPQFAKKRMKFKEVSLVRITACHYSGEDKVITIGLSSGRLMQFTRCAAEQKELVTGKSFEIKAYFEPNSHKGEVSCIIAEQFSGGRYYITGSVDRTIKFWFFGNKFRNVRKRREESFLLDGYCPTIVNVEEEVVTQTLVGHGGTVCALVYSVFMETLFSASNDKTIRVWRNEKKRDYFFHPWFVQVQTITGFSPLKTPKPVYCTTFQLKDKEKDQFFLLTGDSEGSLHQIVYEEKKAPRLSASSRDDKCLEDVIAKPEEDELVLKRTKQNYHRLSIIQVLSVPKDGFVFSVGYDQQIRGFEELSDKTFFSLKNPHKKLFTALVWNEAKFQLIAADEAGYLYFINFGSEKETEEIKKYDCKILRLEIVAGLLLVVTENFVDVIEIKRSARYNGVGDSHNGPIMGIFGLEPSLLTNFKINDPPKLVTISLDNTLRVWDPSDFGQIAMLPNDKEEFASLHYLRHANLFATGHENGDVKLWNIELGNSITLIQQDSPWRHSSNVCALASFVYSRGDGSEDTTEFLFSSGYDGRINVWQIFEKKSLVSSALMSSTICPQLKYSVLANKAQKTADEIGDEILVLQFFEGRLSRAGKNNYIIAAGNRAVIYVIRMFTFQHEAHLEGHRDSINALVLDEMFLFSGSDDCTVRMWDMNELTPLAEVHRGESPVLHLRMIPDLGFLCTSDLAGEIFLLDYPNERVVRKYRVQKKEKLLCLCYIQELKKLVGGTDRHRIVSFPIDRGEEEDLVNCELSEQSEQADLKDAAN